MTGGRHGAIYADPPWRYSDKRPGFGGCERHYATMTPAELRALPVEQLAAPDCALFLWATAPMLRVALGVMRAWGFEFKTVAFVWVKRGESGKLAWGAGQYTRANAEYVLLGTRGSPKVQSHAVHQIVEAPRRAHSAKPSEVRRRIEQLMGDVPRVELFAREAAPGWVRFGFDAPAGEGVLELVEVQRVG